MVKRRLLGPITALLLALTPSCLGGQTGQPDSATGCEPRALPVGSSWQGRTAAELAAAFEGTHRASLDWREEALSSQQQTPVAFEDAIAISIRASGAAGTLVSCDRALDIAVQVEVTTSESGLRESGIGTLSFTKVEPVLTAELSFDGATLVLFATMTQTDAALAPQGWFVPQVAGAPGGSARIR
ncbi:MAG TPA: hypothetical protein VM686_09340 [Polyangiaceae bacterium]|nr:hypothetical protein [Polyangiaceae bacterium]